MKNADRGMVKYAPYQSLVEQAKSLAAMRERKSRVEKRILLEDEASAIDEILRNYDGEVILAVYWKRGSVLETEGVIDIIDAFERVIWVNGERIPLKDLQSLNRKTAPVEGTPPSCMWGD